MTLKFKMDYNSTLYGCICHACFFPPKVRYLLELRSLRVNVLEVRHFKLHNKTEIDKMLIAFVSINEKSKMILETVVIIVLLIITHHPWVVFNEFCVLQFVLFLLAMKLKTFTCNEVHGYELLYTNNYYYTYFNYYITKFNVYYIGQ